jgi:peptidoglycan hydrolase-like protein with peptidoglycan-binding domain
MRRLSFWSALAAMAMLTFGAWSAGGAVKKKKSAASTAGSGASSKKSGASSKKSAASKKAAASKATASRKSSKRTAAWRTRQAAPTPERYKDIQQALASKGYLDPGQVDGNWGSSSTEALKRFQAEQKIEPSGKINSLSLIALGLGPKRETPALPKPPGSPETDAPGK